MPIKTQMQYDLKSGIKIKKPKEEKKKKKNGR